MKLVASKFNCERNILCISEITRQRIFTRCKAVTPYHRPAIVYPNPIR